jgi:hypothetical protein
VNVIDRATRRSSGSADKQQTTVSARPRVLDRNKNETNPLSREPLSVEFYLLADGNMKLSAHPTQASVETASGDET